MLGVVVCEAAPKRTQTASLLSWTHLPDLPDQLGFAGALSGECGDNLVFAGGSNFPAPTWMSTKHFDDGVWTLAETVEGLKWTKHQLPLPRPMAYAACGTLGGELVCAGGQNADGILQDTFAISCSASQLRLFKLPQLPVATSFASAAITGNQLWVIGGQTGPNLTSATRDVWVFDMEAQQWHKGPLLPSSRILSLTIIHDQHLYVMSGRRQEEGGDPEFLKDCWKLKISQVDSGSSWDPCANLPTCAMAGTIAHTHDDIFVLGGDDGSHFGQDTPSNPGYPKKAYVYDIVNDAWASAGSTTEGEVTTRAIPWKNGLVINGGEVKPRVRTNHTWLVSTADSVKRPKRKRKEKKERQLPTLP